jgi:hypothetical protein
VFGIADFSGPDTVRLAPASESHRVPERGDWVEVSGETSERSGRVGTLARVESVHDGGLLISLDRRVERHRDEPRPRARLWDSPAVLTGSEPIALESGIEVRFSGGGFRAGDYWTIPARPGATTVDWPEERPQGPEHRSCALALVTWDGSTHVVRDCRRLFSPLTDLRVEVARLAAEVTELRRRLEG